MLCQKLALKDNTHNPSFAILSRNDCVAAAIKDIEDVVFWKAIYCIHLAVFPALVRIVNKMLTKFHNILGLSLIS